MLSSDYARQQMINQQLRTWDVLDDRVLTAVGSVARDEFVPARYADLAFADFAIPLAHGETMLPPKLEGRILQALTIARDDAILLIGAGTGYLAACLGRLGSRVVAYEQHADLAAEAEERLHRVGLTGNIEVRAEAFTATTQPGRFDAVALTGSVADIPANLAGTLNPGGRAFAVIGAGVVQHATLLTAGDAADSELRAEYLFETELAPLRGFEAEQRFSF